MPTRTLVLDGHSLTIEDVVAVAYARPDEYLFQLSPEAQQRVARARQAVEDFVAQRRVVYGITTGFGAFCNRVIDPEQTAQLQRNIVMSHAVGVGRPLETPVVRAMMLIRANTLAKGHSGCRQTVIDLLLRMLEQGVHPVIPRQGSLGASGDLAPLAHMALVLIGLGEAELDGQIRAGRRRPWRAAGLAPLELQAKEGLALTNGTTLMAALGAWPWSKPKTLRLRGRHRRLLEPRGAARHAHGLRPAPAGRAAAPARGRMRGPPAPAARMARPSSARFDGSHSGASSEAMTFEPQDAYTLRCIPQVHGACHDAVKYARWVIEIELNAATDNPLIFIDETSGQVDVLSGGNFHGEPLAIAFDYLALAMTELGNMAERRLTRLVDGASNRHVLPDFLTQEGGLQQRA